MHQYYVYEHWRKDKHECFYVGIGKVPNEKKVLGFNTKYSRAFEKSKRTTFWKNIVAKTDYEVKIVFESTILKNVEDKEIELIKLYGRKFANEGSLVNFDLGGNHSGGYKRDKSLPILQIDIETGIVIEEWNQPRDIEETLGYLKTNIVKCCRSKQITAYGYIWHYKNIDYSNIIPSAARKKTNNNRIGVEVYDLDGNFIEKLRSIKDTAKKYNLNYATIWNYISGKKISKFYKFKYAKW